MLTDADWNELGDIIKERLEDALRDVIGSGSPRDRGMIRVQPGPGGDTVTLHWGQVYVDGVPADVRPRPDSSDSSDFNYAAQADFPLPPALPAPDTDYLLYLDVWERAVTSLEDSELRDPGLHGADTSTRTRTMAQVKWCPADVNPEDPAINPPTGNAPLTLVLRRGSTEADPCDPCADEVALQERVGNYLFRVEVHDVELGSDGKAERLVLKWSSENGAEEYPVGSEPPGFKTGRRAFEFFSGASQAHASEKHLGVHLATGTWKPVRGALSTGYPSTLPAGYTQVRRWDGYCTLERDGDTWSLAEDAGGAVLGSDRGVTLSTASADGAPGHVALGASLEIHLDALVLTLELEDKSFVAGDYWYAVVREAAHRSGDAVLSASTPVGVIHHYMTLARVSGGVITAYQGEQCQRSPFPSLTDVRARDVCYDNTDCDGPDIDTVQEALDYLCQQRDLRHHNKHLHGWGIVCGLQVQCGPDTSPGGGQDEPARRQVTVRKGYAIDCEGNDIVIDGARDIDVLELIKAYDSTHEEPLLSEGMGTACLTVEAGKQGKPRFGVTPYQADDDLLSLLKGTIWDDFFNKCIKDLIDELRDEFTPEPGDESLVGPVQKRITTLLNLAVHLLSQDGQYVFLSPKEHDILEKLYVRLRDLLQSKTFCGMYAGDDFPDYPFPKTTLSTIFGKGFHSRMRLHPGGDRAYTCSGTDTKIHVYDLAGQEMIAELDMPAGEGAEVKDVALSPDGKRLYAVAVLRDTDTIFGVADIADGEHTWRPVTVLCDVKLVTLAAEKELLYAIGMGTGDQGAGGGLFVLVPDELLDQDKPQLQPRFAFNATGQMSMDEFTGWVYAAASSSDGETTRYDRIAAMNPREDQDDNQVPTSISLSIGQELVSGDDDMVWASIEKLRMGAEQSLVCIVVDSEQGKRLRAYAVVGAKMSATNIDIPLEDTVVRLAYHPSARKVLATMANGFRMQIIDVASNKTTIFRHPVQIMPIAIATAAKQERTYVLNFASNTITVIPDSELDVASEKYLEELRLYRYQVIARFLHLLGGLLQYLKDCLCDRLLVDCPSCEEDTLYLACVEVRESKVYRICNFSKRKYVKSFPTVGYWMSLVPIMPLAKKAVEKICCSILPNFFDQIADKYKPHKESPATGIKAVSGLRADTVLGAVTLARRADVRGEVRAQKKSLDVYRRLTADALVDRVRETSVAAAGVRKSLFVGSDVKSARERLSQRHIEVASVERYDPDKSGSKLAEFRDTPSRVSPGARVKLYERDGKVLFYAPVKEQKSVAMSPEIEAKIEVLERRKAALRDMAAVDAELTALEARRAEAVDIAEVSSLRTEFDTLKAELDTLRAERAREAERLSELDNQRKTMLAGVASLQTSLEDLGKQHKELSRELARARPVREVEGVSDKTDAALRELGVRSVAELAGMDVNRLAKGANMDPASAERLVASAKKRLKE